MSDSSWQHAVLREIGVSRRGFQMLDATPNSPAQGSWGAEAPPRPAPEQQPAAAPVPQPAPQPVQAASPAPPEVPPFAAPVEPGQDAPDGPAPLLPEPQPLLPQPSEPSPQPAAQQPVAPQPAAPPPFAQPMAAQQAPPQQAAEQAAAERAAAEQAAAQQAAAQQAAAQQAAEQAAAERAAAEQAAAQQAAAQQAAAQQAAAQQAAAQQAAAQQAAAEQPTAEGQAHAQPEHLEPLIGSDFDWEAAVNPVLGAVPSSTDAGRQADANAAAPAPQAPAHPVPAEQAGGGHQIPAHDLVRKNQHGDPLARRMGRGVRNAMGGGGREARERAAFADLMQRQVPSSRQIAVASVRGGAGKTTMAAMVATELARHRADRVLAADADAELGSLPLRLGVRSQLSLFDLAAQNPHTFEEAERFLTRTPDGLYVLSSTRDGRIAGEFTLETFQTALSAVSRYVSATVVDCGAGILTEVNRGVIASSHGLVLVTPGTVDGALSARGALEWFSSNNQQALLPRTVIAMVSHAPQVGADLQRAHQMLTAWGLPVVSVPYDRQLATGSSVDMSRISAAARAAVTHVVYEVFSRSLTAGVTR
ncbi:MinD/ParA family protein [Actinomadura sp. NPDC000600]|uniref:AAA family ATPase n=1 Tax=Actinomadura sp. NPDC000600 TaxID=3154262 RepID=UPI00339872DF